MCMLVSFIYSVLALIKVKHVINWFGIFRYISLIELKLSCLPVNPGPDSVEEIALLRKNDLNQPLLSRNPISNLQVAPYYKLRSKKFKGANVFNLKILVWSKYQTLKNGCIIKREMGAMQMSLHFWPTPEESQRGRLFLKYFHTVIGLNQNLHSLLTSPDSGLML